jgi:hypothetical protein
LAATADTVLVVRSHPYEYSQNASLERELASVVAPDADSGAEVSRIEVSPTGDGSPDPESDSSVGTYPPILVAGKLIFQSANGRPNLFVLAEPD